MSVDAEPDRAVRRLVRAAAGVQLAVVLSAFVAGMVLNGDGIDPFRPVAIAVIYASPAWLAFLSLRGRPWLLLAASLAALLLAIIPFSPHSFLLGPAGIVYAVLVAHMPSVRHGAGPVLAVVLCALLPLAALFALVAHEDPVCYSKTGSGRIVTERATGDVRSGVGTIGPDSDVVERGCTGDTVTWWEAAASLSITASAGLAGVLLGSRRHRQQAHETVG
jgi:hypothetical protein